MKLRQARKIAKTSARRGTLSGIRHTSETRRRAASRLHRHLWSRREGCRPFPWTPEDFMIHRLISQEYRRRHYNLCLKYGFGLSDLPDLPRAKTGTWGAHVVYPPDGNRIAIALAGGDWAADWDRAVRARP